MFKLLLKVSVLFAVLTALLWTFFTFLGLVQLAGFAASAALVGLVLGVATVGIFKWKKKSR